MQVTCFLNDAIQAAAQEVNLTVRKDSRIVIIGVALKG